MVVLGIETSCHRLGVAIRRDEATIASFHATAHGRHSEVLAATIDFALRSVALGLDDVQVLSVDVGPGSFTGLRIGIATAHALAHARRLPLVGVTSLEAIATSALWTRPYVAAATDARRGRVYYAIYERTSPLLTPVRPPCLGSPSELRAAIRELPGECQIAGSGAHLYADLLTAQSSGLIAPPSLSDPSAAAVAEVGAKRFEADASNIGSTVEPLYLRAPDATPSKHAVAQG